MSKDAVAKIKALIKRTVLNIVIILEEIFKGKEAAKAKKKGGIKEAPTKAILNPNKEFQDLSKMNPDIHIVIDKTKRANILFI